MAVVSPADGWTEPSAAASCTNLRPVRVPGRRLGKEPVTLSDWVAGSDADGEIRLPAEALLRLLYGRVDPGHTPEHTAGGIGLDRLRAVFPGL